MGKPMDRSNRFCSPLTTFERAFPTLETVTIASYETGKGVRTFGLEPRKTYAVARPLRGGLVPCSNPRCYGGGYEVDHILSEMVSERLTEKEYVQDCPGEERSPKRRRTGMPCFNALHYRLTVKYKPKGASAT